MTLRISISGPRSGGKTTAAAEITKALRGAGFTDIIVDDTGGDDDHVGLPVAGYANRQSDLAVQLVNQNKKDEERLLRLIDTLESGYTPDTMATIEIDRRWLAKARTSIEEGFMFLNRSIFRPQRLQGDL